MENLKVNYAKDIARLSNRLDSIGLYKEANMSDKILLMASKNKINDARNSLVLLADHLDQKGMYKESDYIDLFLKKYAFEFSLEQLGQIPEMLSDLAGEGFGAVVREIKEGVVLHLISSLGFSDDSPGAEFVANLVAGLTFGDMKAIYYADDKCMPITKEIVAALEKTLIEQLLTRPFLEKVEDKIEGTVQGLFGIEEGGWADNALDKAIKLEVIEEMLTFYLTQDSVVTNKIAELICGYIKDFSPSKAWDSASDSILPVLEDVSDYLPDFSDFSFSDLKFWE